MILATYQVDDTGWCRLVFRTFCIEEKTFASFLSPSSNGMGRLEVLKVLAANVGVQRLWSGRCIIQPEEMVMESKFPRKRSVKNGNVHGVVSAYKCPGAL